MFKRVIALLTAAAAPFAGAGELDIARQALRDGLYDVARHHAEKSEGDEAKQVVVESYAREGRWDDVLKALDAWHDPSGDAFLYYKSLALAKTGKGEEAIAVLDGHDFKDAEYAMRVQLVRASVAMDSGNVAGALGISRAAGFASGDDASKMLAADILAASGDRKGAEAIWREIASFTNAEEAVLAAAAGNLGDEASLRSAYERVKHADLRRSVGLRLGRRLLEDGRTFDEGVKLIRLIAKDSPGFPGAKDAFLAAADAFLEKGKYQESADAYREALEAWPDAAREFAVHEGRGWALRKLQKHEESLEAFARAEELATNDVDRATALMEQGDVMSECGRGAEAMAKYRTVLDKYPSTPAGEKLKVVVELREKESEGRELYRSFRFKEAQEVFAELGRRDPARKPRMDYLEMLCLYGQVRDAEASRKAKDLAAGSPDPEIRAEATLWLAKFFYNARQWADSCELFTNYATNMVPSSAQAPSALVWAARAAFAGGEFQRAIDLVTKLAKDYPDAAERPQGFLVQGEALVELSRLDEAILVLDGVVTDKRAGDEERTRGKTLKADALFVMGADNPSRYKEALQDYRALQLGESLSDGRKLVLSFKIARTLEKLGRVDEALDQYYVEVVCAYRAARDRGERLDDEARATFARAAFRLADEYESRGEDRRAESILRLVIKSDVGPAVKEAKRRRDRIQRKGMFQ